MNTNVNMHQRGGSLNIHELYQHYHQKPKSPAVARVGNHQPVPTNAAQINSPGVTPQQAATMQQQNNIIAGAATAANGGAGAPAQGQQVGPDGNTGGVYPQQK